MNKKIKLTNSSVKALPLPERGEITKWDSEDTGFGVRMRSKGSKTFIVQYRTREGRQRKLTIGPFGRIHAEQARKKAREVLAEAQLGSDPAGNKMRERRNPTLNDAFKGFRETHLSKLKPKTVYDYEKLFKQHLSRRFGTRTVLSIENSELYQLHADMRSTPYQANRVLALASKFFNWCEAHGYRERNSNPCHDIKKYKEEKRGRVLSSEELAKLGDELLESENSESPWAIAAIRLLIFTGLRRNEVLSLLRSDINLERKQVHLRDSKTGEAYRMLSAQAIAIINNIPPRPDNPYLICGRKPGTKLIGLPKVWQRIRERVGLNDVRIHDLRHTFASYGLMSGLTLPEVGRLLGHSRPSMTDRYAHFAQDPLLVATNQVADRIDDMMHRKASSTETV